MAARLQERCNENVLGPAMRHPFRLIPLLLAGVLAVPAPGWADEVRVVSSGGFAAALKELAPRFEQATGNTLVLQWGPSMGTTVDAVPQRLARGEGLDVLIMVGYALDKLVADGKVAAADDVPLAESLIGLVVKQGAPVPDISDEAHLRQVLLGARSIAYSDSASGVYIEREMFRKLGIEDQVRGKARMIPAEPVGQVVARGEAEVGFQQISELKPIHGITLVGPIPAPEQQATVFSAGVLEGSAHKAAARALVRFLADPAAAATIRDSGMEPVPPQGAATGARP